MLKFENFYCEILMSYFIYPYKKLRNNSGVKLRIGKDKVLCIIANKCNIISLGWLPAETPAFGNNLGLNIIISY